MSLFNVLPGFVRTPPGLEREILRKLPRWSWAGTLLLCVPSLLVHWATALWPALGASKTPGMIDIMVISFVVLYWTTLLTVGIGAFIVMVMKGPAYVADPYPLSDADRP